MKILGIDTILHNTCASVVENGRRALSNIIRSHKFDSSRLYDLPLKHRQCLAEVMARALKKASARPEEIGLIAVNNFGSQFSNVLVGLTAARTLGVLYKIPIIGVHHQEAHFFSCWLERDPADFDFPVVVFSASGGHSAVILIKNARFQFEIIAETEGMREDKKNLPNFRGLGAIYSFAAYNLGLGGQIGSASLLSRFSKKGNPGRFNFNFRRPRGSRMPDFGFLENEISAFLEKQKKKGRLRRRFIEDFAAGFEESASNLVLSDLAGSAKKYRAKEVHLVGGVSANYLLRKKIPLAAAEAGFIGRVPAKPEYSTDNAAMIASLGYYLYRQNPGKCRKKEIPVISNLRLEKMAIEQISDKKPKGKFYDL